MSLSDYTDNELKEELARRHTLLFKLPESTLMDYVVTFGMGLKPDRIDYEGPYQHLWWTAFRCKYCNKQALTWSPGLEESATGKTECPKHPDREKND